MLTSSVNAQLGLALVRCDSPSTSLDNGHTDHPSKFDHLERRGRLNGQLPRHEHIPTPRVLGTRGSAKDVIGRTRLCAALGLGSTTIGPQSAATRYERRPQVYLGCPPSYDCLTLATVLQYLLLRTPRRKSHRQLAQPELEAMAFCRRKYH